MPTEIPWATETWNPVTGCTPVSAGCKNCYAKRIAKRFWGKRKFSDVQCHEDRLSIPSKWKKPRRIFTCSMGDLFHQKVDYNFIYTVLQVIEELPRHTFMMLTKRDTRMQEELCRCYRIAEGADIIPNLQLGVTIEHPNYLYRANTLRETPAAVRFISAEPLLCDISGIDLTEIDGVICGCESGAKARPTETDWIRRLRDKCVKTGTAFFLKQRMVGGKLIKMPELDGQRWAEFPERKEINDA